MGSKVPGIGLRVLAVTLLAVFAPFIFGGLIVVVLVWFPDETLLPTSLEGESRDPADLDHRLHEVILGSWCGHHDRRRGPVALSRRSPQFRVVERARGSTRDRAHMKSLAYDLSRP